LPLGEKKPLHSEANKFHLILYAVDIYIHNASTKDVKQHIIISNANEIKQEQRKHGIISPSTLVKNDKSIPLKSELVL
jgi:hypothetical protein